jgi:hypothetical protein
MVIHVIFVYESCGLQRRDKYLAVRENNYTVLLLATRIISEQELRGGVLTLPLVLRYVIMTNENYHVFSHVVS